MSAKKIFPVLLLLCLVGVSNQALAQVGVSVSVPSDKIDVRNYRTKCGEAACQAAAMAFGASFDNPYIIPRENFNKFLSYLQKLCGNSNSTSTTPKKEPPTADRENYDRKVKQLEQEERIRRNEERLVPIVGTVKGNTQTSICNLGSLKYRNEVFHNQDAFGQQTSDANEITDARQDDSNYFKEFIQQEQREKIVAEEIGYYQDKSVYKVGDTIVTVAGNYLLSQQVIVNKGDNDNFIYPYGNEFRIIHKPIGKSVGLTQLQTGQANAFSSADAIGFVTNENGLYQFYEFVCDEVTYQKFLDFCDWQICKMENTVNISRLSFQDYQKQIEEDMKLNNLILQLNLQDAVTSITNSVMSDLTKGTFDLNTSLRDFTIKGLVNFTTERKLTGQAGACVNTSLSAVEKYGNQQYKNFSTVTVGDYIGNEKIRDMYKTEFQKSVEDAYHTFFDLLDDCSPNMSKRLIVYKIFPEIVNAGMMFAANTTIKFYVKPEYEKMLTDHINACKTKKQMLDSYRQDYDKRFKAANGNGLEYTRAVNDLKSGRFKQVANNYTDELVKLMQEYVFGNGKIGTCKVSDTSELRKNNNKQIQPQAEQFKTNYVAIALLDTDGANGVGHAGLILGDLSRGFLYYSHANSGNPKYSNPDNYMDCQAVSALIRKNNNYSQSFILYISQDIFKKMNYGASISVNSEYGLLKNSCLGLLIDAFEAGGYETGFSNPVPNARFSKLQENTNGETVDITQLCSELKLQPQSEQSKKVQIPKRNH
ncbi:MAG: hypothetical protein LBR13_06015 [Dysgonamonadaceae bacterium]|jgi:hypothetical protein|nr:hypothetical protein [Dysgonamonadaceae bacterium]